MIFKNRSLILDIRNSISIEIQMGGGIRTKNDISFWIKNGIDFVIVGSINLPTNAAEVSVDGQTRVQWFAPRSWIIFSNDNNISSVIENTFNNEDFAVTDISHSRAIIQIKGEEALKVLKK